MRKTFWIQVKYSVIYCLEWCYFGVGYHIWPN